VDVPGMISVLLMAHWTNKVHQMSVFTHDSSCCCSTS